MPRLTAVPRTSIFANFPAVLAVAERSAHHSLCVQQRGCVSLQDKVDRLYHSDCPNTCFSDFLTKSVYHIAQQTDMFVFFLDLCLLFAAWIFRYGCCFSMHPLVNQIPFTRPIKLGLIFKA